MRIVAGLVLLAGCSFHPGQTGRDGAVGDVPIDDIVIDGPGSDAAPDAAVDGPPADCWAAWIAQTIQPGAPVPLDGVNSTSYDRDPFLAPDELSFFVSSSRSGALGGTDVWIATRATTGDTFGTPVVLTQVSSTEDETKFSFTSDGLYGVVGSNRTGGAGGVDVWETSRASTNDPWGTPEQTHLANVNTGNDDHDPTISADGLHLYLAPANSPQVIALATRTSRAADFGAPVTLAELDSGMGDADPTVSPDERVIVFTSARSGAGVGGGNLWYAVRASATDTFGTPVPIPNVNTDANEGDAHVSSDGCRLYFGSDRTSGQSWDTFVSTVP